MSIEPVIFPDVELWATGWLRAALATRAETYAQNVLVGIVVPTTRRDRMVMFRRDGGRQLDAAREAPRLSVNVWGRTEQEVSDLARLVAALLWSAPDGEPVCRVQQLSGPSPIADEQPRRFMSFELITRGAELPTL